MDLRVRVVQEILSELDIHNVHVALMSMYTVLAEFNSVQISSPCFKNQNGFV